MVDLFGGFFAFSGDVWEAFPGSPISGGSVPGGFPDCVIGAEGDNGLAEGDLADMGRGMGFSLEVVFSGVGDLPFSAEVSDEFGVGEGVEGALDAPFFGGAVVVDPPEGSGDIGE